MTKLECPHCNKNVEIEVVNSTPSAGSTPTTTSTPKSEGPMVNTEQAKQMRNKINIEGIVSKKEEKRTINKKDGGTVDVADAQLTDDSGEIKLVLWGDEVSSVKEGSKIKITNGYTNTFKGEVSLTKGKYGTLEVLA